MKGLPRINAKGDVAIATGDDVCTRRDPASHSNGMRPHGAIDAHRAAVPAIVVRDHQIGLTILRWSAPTAKLMPRAADGGYETEPQRKPHQMHPRHLSARRFATHAASVGAIDLNLSDTGPRAPMKFGPIATTPRNTVSRYNAARI